MVYSINTTYTLNVNTMEKAVRKLISSSLRLRAWTTLSNYKAIHTSLQNTTNTAESFQTANTARNFQQNYGDVNGRKTIKMIHDLGQMLNAGLYPKYIKGSNDIVKICNKIERDIRYLNSYDIIRSLRILISLNVSFNTKLNQRLLQLLRVSINDLTIVQLSTLYSLLHKAEKVPLVKALLSALPHAFRNRVHYEIDNKNIFDALIFARNIEDIQTLQYILNILCTNLRTVQLKHMVSIFHALYILPHLFNSHLNLLSKVTDTLIVGQAQLLMKEVSFLLALISNKFIEKDGETHLYNENLIHALCNNIVNNNINFHGSIIILKKLNAMHFCNISLLDHLAVQCVKNNYLSTNCDLLDVCTFIKGLVIGDYKMQSPEIIQKLLDYFVNSNCTVNRLAIIAVHLLSLGYYCPELFEKVFTLYYCGYDDIKNQQTMRDVLRLHQALQFLHPEYNGVTLSLDMVDKAIGMIHIVNVSSLHENFIQVLGDAKYIKTNLRTKLGHIIDFAIVLQSDGSPMAINDYNNDITFVEDILCPPDCCKLLICMLPGNAYCTNLQNLQSLWKLTLNVIKAATGANVLAVNLHLLKTLSDNEKNMYLRKVLKLESKVKLDCIKC